MLKVAVLVSGGGTNLQAILDAVDSGKITNAKVEKVISNVTGAYALERAKNHNVTGVTLRRKDFDSKADWEKAKRYLEAANSLGSYEAAVRLKAMTLAEEECIKANGSLENTPKEQKSYHLAAAMDAVLDIF